MPRPKSAPTVVRRRLFGKSASTAKRAAKLQGVRSGFAAPAPSRVPVGALETKVQRQALRQLTPSNTGTVIPINSGLKQGTAVFKRIGHKFKTTAARVKGQFFADYDGPRAAIAGYAWVWDKSPNGTLPAVNEIFTVGLSGYDMSNTLLVDDNSDRFTVLKSTRKTIGRLMAGAGADAGYTNNLTNVVLVDDMLKLPNWAVSAYTKGTTDDPTTATHQTGALYIVPFVKNLSGEVTNSCKFDFTTELFFSEG